MTQNEAMHMSNEQAVQILKPMMYMMRDQHGCPISDAYFAIEKAIRALSTVSPDEVRGKGKWILKQDNWWDDYAECSICHDEYTVPEGGLNFKFCPNCGAKMEVSEDE